MQQTDESAAPSLVPAIATAVAIIALLVSILALGKALASGPGPAIQGPGETSSEAEDVSSVLTEFAIAPDPLTIDVGGRIAATNDGLSIHNLAVKGLDLTTPDLATGESATLDTSSLAAGTYTVLCTIAGHEAAGMVATLVVGDGSGSGPPASGAPAQPGEPRTAASIVRPAADVGTPVGDREPQTVQVELETVELEGQLADGTTYDYWTFDGTVPGPMLRVRVGDTVELTLSNSADSRNTHSIDLHAVNGPGGGAVDLQVAPGEARSVAFRALNPGVYVYHCATPHIPTHIANGMYGLIVVEPPGGLAPVDREFYVMQGEIYSDLARGAPGAAGFDGDKLDLEHPTYVVFNGEVNALTGDRALRATVGERVRLFVGNAGPSLISSFHVIGEIFDVVHDQGAAETSSNVQTTLIPAGGAAWVEFTPDIPGDYLLVDHAIGRAIDKGALAILTVDGQGDPEVYAPR